MTGPTIQTFFETPLVQCTLLDANTGTAVEAAHALAKAFTVDVSMPVMPRFRWSDSVREIRLGPAEKGDWQMSSGRFWVAYVCVSDTLSEAGISIEDPRAATLAVGIPGLSVTPDSTIEHIPAESLLLTMLPGYLRHRLVSCKNGPSRWLEVSLAANPID